MYMNMYVYYPIHNQVYIHDILLGHATKNFMKVFFFIS